MDPLELRKKNLKAKLLRETALRAQNDPMLTPRDIDSAWEFYKEAQKELDMLWKEAAAEIRSLGLKERDVR